MKKKSSTEYIGSGFTIIELLIVMSIAALILLLIFMAVPALRRNFRNTQRKADAALVVSAIRECQTNLRSNELCAIPSNVQLDTSKLGIYTNIHYGSTSFSCVDGACIVPPTQDEPNYLFGLVCNDSGTWFGPSNAQITFVVGFIYERANGQFAGRCIDGG